MGRSAFVSVVLLLALILASNTVYGQHFEFTETFFQHTIIVVEATIDGDALVENDEIGVFDADGNCYGASNVEAEGENLAVLANGEDAPDPGFADGERIHFRFWDASAGDDGEELEAQDDQGGIDFEVDGFTQNVILIYQSEAAPVIAVSEDALAFGDVEVEGSSDLTFEISNNGAAALTIESITNELGVYTTDFGDQEVTIEAEGDPVEVTVTFTPDAEGDFNDALTITSNDDNNPSVEVGLSGTGVVNAVADISLSTDSHDFGEVFTEESA